MSNKEVVIFDLDGTLADGRHRLHLLPTENLDVTESWREFNMAAAADSPFQDNIDLCNTLYRANFHILILTGRADHALELTEKWLADNGVKYDNLIMRSHNDNRKDTDFKREIVMQYGLENILCCFDDLPHVAKAFRDLGLTCHLVTEYTEQRVDLNSHGRGK